jgi:hypothetical protein
MHCPGQCSLELLLQIAAIGYSLRLTNLEKVEQKSQHLSLNEMYLDEIRITNPSIQSKNAMLMFRWECFFVYEELPD